MGIENDSFTRPDGTRFKSEGPNENPEEKLKEEQKFDHAYALWLQGKGSKPVRKNEGEEDNVIEFPGNIDKRKAA